MEFSCAMAITCACFSHCGCLINLSEHVISDTGHAHFPDFHVSCLFASQTAFLSPNLSCCCSFAMSFEEVSHVYNIIYKLMLATCRIFTCLRALIFGEDFSSDPVSRVLGLIVHKSSRGQVQLDTAILSQVRPSSLSQVVALVEPLLLLCAIIASCLSRCQAHRRSALVKLPQLA